MTATSSKTRKRVHAGISLFLAVAMAAWPVGAQAPAGEELFEPPKFLNATLEIVLSQYSELTGRTSLFEPGLPAVQITLRSQTKLTKSEYIFAIKSILAMNNIALIDTGDKFVKIVKADTARGVSSLKTDMDSMEASPETDQIISRVLAFKHMDIQEATAILTTLKSPHGKIDPLERINGVLVTDSAANVNRILEVLDRIDRPIETREKLNVLPVRFAKASEIKAKIEEIIAEFVAKKPSTPTVGSVSKSGPPIPMPPRASPVPVLRAEPSSSEAEVDKGIVRGQVKIVADDRTGVLIFITQPANMRFFEDVVAALDKPTDPDVSVRVYRLEFAKADKIEAMLNTLIGAKTSSKETAAKGKTGETGKEGEASKSVALEEFVRPQQSTGTGATARKSKVGELSAENVKILSDERTNALIIMASKSDMITIEELIKGMDMMLSQVLIEVVIIDVKLSDSLQTGVDWIQRSMIAYEQDAAGKQTAIAAFTGKGGGGTLTPVDATGVPAYPTGAGLFYYLTYFGLNVDAVINMAEKDSRTRIVSTPVILTTDNTEAKLTATEQIYVYKGKTYQSNTTTTSPADYNYDIKDVGLELTVTPHINTNRLVMMEIKQSMSEPGSVGEPQSGARISSTRTINATVAVGDKETVILGGQVRKSMAEGRNKIPLLGSVPLIGRLFSSATDTDDRSETIVLLTPYVLDSTSEIEAESARRKRELNLAGLWQRGWSNSKLAEPTAKDRREIKKKASEQERLRKEQERADERARETEERTRSDQEKAEARAFTEAKEKAEARAAAEAEEIAKARAAAEAEENAAAEAAQPQPAIVEQQNSAEAENEPQFTTEPAPSTGDARIREILAERERQWQNSVKDVDQATAQP